MTLRGASHGSDAIERPSGSRQYALERMAPEELQLSLPLPDRYYERVAADDLVARAVPDLFGAAHAHLRLARHRVPGEPKRGRSRRCPIRVLVERSVRARSRRPDRSTTRSLREIGSRGATTLAPSNVDIEGDEVRLSFRGKSRMWVEAAVNDVENVFCYDIDDLRSVVEANIKERQREARRAQSLLEREVVKFAERLQHLEVVPTIVSLREKLEAIRRAELARALGRLPAADEETRRVMESLSQSIVNKVLHAPMVKLKDSSRAGHGRRWTEMISELFGLRGPDRPTPGE